MNNLPNPGLRLWFSPSGAWQPAIGDACQPHNVLEAFDRIEDVDRTVWTTIKPASNVAQLRLEIGRQYQSHCDLQIDDDIEDIH